MKTLQKILFLIFIVGFSVMVLMLVVKDNNVVQLKNEFCNSQRSDVHIIITVAHRGQLGNNIWEYMSLVTFVRLYNKLNFSAYIPVLLKARMEYIFERVNIQQIAKIPKSCLKQEPYCLHLNESLQYDELLNKSKCPLTLTKYSARYNEVIQYGIKNIKNDLRFQKKYVDYSHKVLNDIKTTLNINQGKVVFVGMHYRGGDYISFLKRNYNLPHGTPNFTFYLKAMNYFKKNYKIVIFILITIDLHWLKKNLPFLQENSKYLIANPNDRDFVKDLVLLSQCNHSIINYGTYGTTGALLSEGTTFVYDLGIPVDHRGPTIAMGIAEKLPNWHLLT